MRKSNVFAGVLLATFAAGAVWAQPAGLAQPTGPARAEAATTVELVPHRAIYDLTLARSRNGRGLEAVRGRILYDFSGSSCEGYALQFRQVSELDSGEGKRAISDLRATTWEDGTAKAFRFSSQNLLDEQPVDTVDGSAERKTTAVAVSLKKPQDKSFDVVAGAVFPTEHMRRIILAARAGQTLLELPVYDGSETGEKIYNTLTVIGKPIPPDEKKPTDAAAGRAELANLIRWPVTISYFEKKEKEDTGEQTPVYAISFQLFENGISRELTLDYNDFVLTGEVTSLEIKKPKPCP